MEVKTFEDEGITFIELKNKVGLELTLCSFGASVYKIEYKGKVMSLSPVSHDQFYSSGIKFGKTVGPIAGRIKGGKILIGGEEVTLPHNEGNNTNHSGGHAIDEELFAWELMEKEGSTCVRFSLLAEPSIEYPNRVQYVVTYELSDDDSSFDIVSETTPEKTSPINVVNHSYFTLGEEDIYSCKLYVDADNVASYDEEMIIKGSEEVNLITDFRDLRPISRYIDDPSLTSNALKGYDHTYYLNKKEDDTPNLVLQAPDFTLELRTSCPAVHVYSANYATEFGILESGYQIKPRCGIAFEPCSYQGNLKAMEVEGGKTKTTFASYHFVDRHEYEKDNDPSKAAAALIRFGRLHDLIEEEDEVYLHNMVLHHLELLEPYTGKLDESHLKTLQTPDEMLKPIENRLLEIGYDAGEASRELCFILGLIAPRPKEVEEEFEKLFALSPKKATEYLYSLSLNTGYVAKEKVDQNIVYDARFDDGADLEISINLSKPEKNNKDIAKLLTQKSLSYPKCVLCYENLGFGGTSSHAARGNIRFVPITLNGGKWYLQYSPYGYFDRHCIVFSKDHTPMAMNRDVFKALFDFVDLFPHYFIGSNSDMPIVGGSILNHEHFQGGKAMLPLLRAPFRKQIDTHIDGVELYEVDFYNTALCILGKDKDKIIDFAEKLRVIWRRYEDRDNDIIPVTEDGVEHSTVTPVLRKFGKVYRLYLILRNNRCDATYPDGIFHAHSEYAHIKHEGIGLIEASGLFILPARLIRQGKTLQEAVANDVSFSQVKEEHEDLATFEDMYNALKAGVSKEDYMADICRKILGNVAVYKQTETGKKGLERFLKEVVK